MHSEVSHSQVSPLVRPLVLPLVPLHCQGLGLAFAASGGFVGIMPLPKDGAPDPDVCGANLDLEETKKGGQGRAGPPPEPSLGSHRMVLLRLSSHSSTQGLF